MAINICSFNDKEDKVFQLITNEAKNYWSDEQYKLFFLKFGEDYSKERLQNIDRLSKPLAKKLTDADRLALVISVMLNDSGLVSLARKMKKDQLSASDFEIILRDWDEETAKIAEKVLADNEKEYQIDPVYKIIVPFLCRCQRASLYKIEQNLNSITLPEGFSKERVKFLLAVFHLTGRMGTNRRRVENLLLRDFQLSLEQELFWWKNYYLSWIDLGLTLEEIKLSFNLPLVRNSFYDSLIKKIKSDLEEELAIFDILVKDFSENRYHLVISDEKIIYQKDAQVPVAPKKLEETMRNEFKKQRENFKYLTKNYSSISEVFFHRGNLYLFNNEYDLAIKDYDKAISLNSSFLRVYLQKGLACQAKGDLEKAVENYTKTLHINPFAVDAYFLRGKLYFSQRDFLRAFHDFSRVIEINPFLAEAYLWRGKIYWEEKDKNKAFQDFQRVMDLKAQIPEAFIYRGKIYEERSDVLQALQDYNKAIQINPLLAEGYLHRGIFFFQIKQFKKALDDFVQVIELNPDNAQVYYYMGLIQKDELDYEKAIKNFTTAISIKDNYTDAYRERGLTYCRKGNYQVAIKDFSHLVEIEEGRAEHYLHRGVAYNMTAQFDLALVDLDRAIELNPDLANAYVGRAKTFIEKGLNEKAITDSAKAIELSPKNANAYAIGAEAYRKLGQFDKAMDFCQKSLELDPYLPEAYHIRGNIHNDREEYTLAVKDIEKAVQLNPYENVFRRDLAVTYAFVGRYEEAKREYFIANDLKEDAPFNTIDIINELAYRCVEINKRREADLLIKQGFKIDKNHSYLNATYGLFLLNQGDIQEASKYYLKAIELNPKDLALQQQYHYKLGIAFGKTGQVEKAREELKKALKLNVEHVPRDDINKELNKLSKQSIAMAGAKSLS